MRATRLFLAFLIAITVSLCSRGADHSSNSPASQDLKKFQVAPGLKVELFASEPLLQNPVCFSIDQQGRFFVVETHRHRKSIFDITANTPWLLDDLSLRTVNDRGAFLARTFATNFSTLTNESELIRLVEDRDGDGRAETSSIFANSFNQAVAGTAAGVLAHGTNVWFTCIPDLWKFTIYDSRFTNATSPSAVPSAPKIVNRKSNIVNRLATGLGVHISVSGHDVHGLIKGHDGRIYFSFGDRGVCVTNREGVVLDVSDTGGVLRCEPDGRDMEIFCIGLRNPQELAFDDYGNLWTVDNDTGGADPCRVLHLVEGGDYGWRMSYQHMKGFGPWVQEELWRGGLDGVLPPAGTVSQGPAGLAFYPGTSMTPQLAGKFVHADFPGGVWAYTVKPRGASYEVADKEKLLWNCWPTDVDFGPDGALYVLDWVQGWSAPEKGRIYRITANAERGVRSADKGIEVQRLLREGMSGKVEKELLFLLGHADRRVRLEAQWKLAERGTNSLAGLLRMAEEGRWERLARIHALWAVGQIMRQMPTSAGGQQLTMLLSLIDDTDPEIRGQAALVLGEGKLFNAERPMVKLLKDSSPRVRLLAVQAYTRRWASEFPAAGRRNSARVYFSNYQKAADQVARVTSALTGAERFTVAEKLGATITGKYPADKLAELMVDDFREPFLTHAVAHFLTTTHRNTGAFDSWFAKAEAPGTRLAAVLRHRFSGNADVARFLSAHEPRLVLDAARAINDVPIPDAFPALAALLEDPRFRDPNWGWAALSNLSPAGPFSGKVRPPGEQVLLRALNANYRLGSESNAAALKRFAADSGTRDPFASNLRAEALFLLGAWEVLPATIGDLSIKPGKDPNHGSIPTVNPENWPGWFDRVVGLWRPLPSRSADAARMALEANIGQLVGDESVEVAEAALETAVKLRLGSSADAAMARLSDEMSPVSLRRKVPAALAVLAPEKLSEAIRIALADSLPEVRASALPFLDRLDAGRAGEILGRIVANHIGQGPAASGTGELPLVQAALDALGRLKGPGADAWLKYALTNLVQGKLPRALELDVVEAAVRRDDDAIKTLLAQRELLLPRTNDLAKWQFTLHGGNADRGRIVFFENAGTQCLRCHQVKGEGGIVGPALDKIARRLSREQLLEATLLPNKTIAAGFENVIVELKDGRSHAGVVKSEGDAELRLESPEEGPVQITKSEILSRRKTLSAMPDGMDQFLSARDLRDLIEYLAALK